MASGVTNRGALRILEMALRKLFNGGTVPTNIYVRLVTDAQVPTVDTDDVTGVTEIAAGNGYTAGGLALAMNATDFDVLTEDDVNDEAFIQVKDVVFTGSSGPLPSSGSGASYAVLTDDNVTDSSREVLAFFDLGGARTVSDGQSLTIQDMELKLAA